MNIPTLPSSAALKRAEEAAPGGARRLFELHCQAIENHECRVNEEHAEKRRQSNHLRLYRYFSVVCGLTLAIASLALCALAIERKTDLWPLAVVLGPIAGIAGVFLWGYRPKDQENKDLTARTRPSLPEPKRVSGGNGRIAAGVDDA